MEFPVGVLYVEKSCYLYRNLFQNTLSKLQALLLEGASPQSSCGVGKGRFLLCCLLLP